MMPKDYSRRYYRTQYQTEDLTYFQVKFKETDLAIGISRDGYCDNLKKLVEKEVIKLRGDLETYIAVHSEFRTSFSPVSAQPGAPPIVREMIRAGTLAGVGPMAAVAGAIAQEVGRLLERHVREVIVENGGDIYLQSRAKRKVAVLAGESPFSHRIAVKVRAEECPVGVCTSSGTVGPSISLGRADAAVVKAADAALADAVATGAGNLIGDGESLMEAVEYARGIEEVRGVLIISGKEMAAWGDIEIVPL